MNESIIYLSGSPGFKEAVASSLGHGWAYKVQDISQELVRFELPQGMTSKRFKSLVGESTLSDHNILLFYDLNESFPSIIEFISLPIKRLAWHVCEMTYRKVKELASNSTLSFLLLGGK